VVRFISTTVLVGSVVGVVYLAVFVGADHVLFDEWQVTVVAVVLGVAMVGLGLGSWYVLRRRFSRGRTSHRLLAILASVPGLLLGAVVATFVLGTLTQSWIRHSSFGNPHGPGVASLTSPPASPRLAAAMLTSTDLGTGWYGITKPNPSLMAITAQETSEGQLVRVKDFIDREHWTGHMWMVDGLAVEVQYEFDSVANAQNYTAIWKAQNPDVTPSPNTVGQTVVMEGVTGTDWRFAAFTVGDNYFEVQEDSPDSRPTLAQFQTVVAAAVAKATVTP
jgi:hypothetical protein